MSLWPVEAAKQPYAPRTASATSYRQASRKSQYSQCRKFAGLGCTTPSRISLSHARDCLQTLLQPTPRSKAADRSHGQIAPPELAGYPSLHRRTQSLAASIPDIFPPRWCTARPVAWSRQRHSVWYCSNTCSRRQSRRHPRSYRYDRCGRVAARQETAQTRTTVRSGSPRHRFRNSSKSSEDRPACAAGTLRCDRLAGCAPSRTPR